jgi:hypothetical protein
MRANLLSLIVVLAGGCASETVSSDALSVQRCQTGSSDPYALGNISVGGAELIADVQTGGGCAEHSFAVCWDGTIVDRSPPTVNLSLSHDAHGDTCHAVLSHDLRVELSPTFDGIARPFRIDFTGATRVAGTSGSVMILD